MATFKIHFLFSSRDHLQPTQRYALRPQEGPQPREISSRRSTETLSHNAPEDRAATRYCALDYTAQRPEGSVVRFKSYRDTQTELMHCSNEWTDLVKVVVGDHKQAFIVHRHILLQIPFVELCLRSGCKESQTGVVHLNTGDAESFNIVLQFLWTGQLSIEKGEDYSENRLTGRSYGRKLIKAYAVASFLVLEKLMNAIIDAAFVHSRRWVPGPDNMNYLHEQNMEDSKLGDFMIRRKAESIRKNGRGALETGTGREFFSEYVLRSEDRAKRMFGALLDQPIAFDNTTSPCAWHTHQHTPICPKQQAPLPSSSLSSSTSGDDDDDPYSPW